MQLAEARRDPTGTSTATGGGACAVFAPPQQAEVITGWAGTLACFLQYQSLSKGPTDEFLERNSRVTTWR